MNYESELSPRRPYRMRSRAEAVRANTRRVLDVAVELFTERRYDDVSIDDVAARAAVGRRTVLRRFGSKDGLFVAAMEAAVEEMTAQRGEAPVGDVPGAVANLVEHYERWGMNRLRLLAQEEAIRVVAEHVAGGRRYHREWVERTFAQQLDGLRGATRRRRVALLVALTDVYTWKLLRRDLGLGRSEVERSLVEAIYSLEGEQS